MIEIDGDGLQWTPKSETLLLAIKDARVMSIKPTSDGRFRIEEKCDDYYSVILTKEQMLMLAEEIKSIANSV